MLRELFSETEQRICDDLNFGVGVVYCTSEPREKTTLRRLDNAPQGDKPTRGTHVFFVILTAIPGYRIGSRCRLPNLT